MTAADPRPTERDDARRPAWTFVGKTVIDPTQRFYRGDSQGGIMGTTYMALSTEVTRGLLGEPGFPYGLLMPRSSDFGLFGLLIQRSATTR